MVRDISLHEGVRGYFYQLPFTKDICLTELHGIDKALAFVVRYVGSQPHGVFHGSNMLVHCDSKDALREVRYAYEGDLIPPPHPELTRGIVDAIRSLELRGITVHLRHIPGKSSHETERVDHWAKEGGKMRRKRVGLPDAAYEIRR